MDNSVLSSVLAGLFALCAVAIASLFVVVLRRVRAENQPVAETPAEGNRVVIAEDRGARQVWLLVGGGLAVAIATAGALLAVDHLVPPSKPIVVKVIAHQFGWQFDYYQAVDSENVALETVSDPRRGDVKTFKIQSLGVSSKDRLTLPKDADVLFLVTSLDVIHRFWVPEFDVRRDVIPGAVTDVWARPTRLGQFIVRSDDVCGAGDRLMVAALDILDGSSFRAWLSQKAAPKER